MPVPCRYGADCTRGDCYFFHPRRRLERERVDRVDDDGETVDQLRDRLASTAAPLRDALTVEKARLFDEVQAVPGPCDSWPAATLAEQQRRVTMIRIIACKQEMLVAGLAALEKMVTTDLAADVKRSISDRLTREMRRADLTNLGPFVTSAREIVVGLRDRPVTVIRSDPGTVSDLVNLRALIMLIRDFAPAVAPARGGVLVLAPGPAALDSYTQAGFKACSDDDVAASLARGRTSALVVPNATRLLRDATTTAGGISMADFRKALADASTAARGGVRLVLLDDSPVGSDAACCAVTEFAAAAIVTPLTVGTGGDRRAAGVGAGAATGGAATAAAAATPAASAAGTGAGTGRE